MTPKNIAITLTTLASLGLGGDAAIYNGATLIDTTIPVAEEVVELKQVDNVVEATFPWKDQQGIKVKYDLGEPTLAEKFKDKRKKEVITETVTDFEGGFKVDLLLNEKPDTNVFCYAIEGAENYDFFYQPPLTQEEIDEGAYRPPEIEGSYAVYHKTLKNHEIGKENYATGKVMHIPRPQVWSMSDVDIKVWADMNYIDGQLCVTVPQDFLNGAKYPVRVDPTFGYTTVGGTTVALRVGGSNAKITSIATLSGDGNVSSISAYVAKEGVPNRLWKGIIYSENPANTPDALQGSAGSEVTTSNTDPTFSWGTSTLSMSLSANNYYVGIIHDSVSDSEELLGKGDALAGASKFNADTYSDGPANPFGSPTTSGFIRSFYATYTESGGGASTTPSQNIILFE